MTHEEKVKRIETLVDTYCKLEGAFDSLNTSIGLDPNSLLFNASWKAFHLALNATAELIGDKFEWLDWYIYENQCGTKGLEAGPKDGTKPINNPEDLLWVIGDKP